MQINQAMFSVNGRCGYVLKPENMRNFELTTTTNPLTQYTLEVEVKKTYYLFIVPYNKQIIIMKYLNRLYLPNNLLGLKICLKRLLILTLKWNY